MVSAKDMTEDDDHAVDFKKFEERRRYRAQISEHVKTVVQSSFTIATWKGCERGSPKLVKNADKTCGDEISFMIVDERPSMSLAPS